MAFNIAEVLSQGLINGGARPTLFDVTMILPSSTSAVIDSNGTAANRLRFTCRAASIPASTLGVVSVPYFGRSAKLAGDREFGDWSVTIFNDEDYQVRQAIEAWSNAINTLQGNVRLLPQGDNSNVGYKTNATIRAYGKAGNPISQYNFVGIYPTTIDAMDMDWEDTNKIQTFNVTFAYDYWTPVAVSSGLPNSSSATYPYNLTSPYGTTGGTVR